MLRLIFGALLFWLLLIAVVYFKLIFEVGTSAFEMSLPDWLWLPYTAPSSFINSSIRAEDKATLFAGLGGTILGGLISWAIARQTAADARATAKENQWQTEKSHALKTVIRVAQLTNGIYTIHRAIEGPIESAGVPDDPSAPIWHLLRQTTHTHRDVNFDADDLTPFTFAGKNNLIQKMMELSTKYNTLSEAYAIYIRKREEFQEFAEPYSRFDPETGQHETILKGEAQVRGANKIFELDGLTKELRLNAAEYHREAQETCTLIDAFTQKRYSGKGGFIKLEMAESVAKVDDAATS